MDAHSLSKGFQRPACYVRSPDQTSTRASAPGTHHGVRYIVPWGGLLSLSPAPGLTAVRSVPLPLLVSSNAAQNEIGKQKGNRRLRRKKWIQAGNKNRSQGASSVLVF